LSGDKGGTLPGSGAWVGAAVEAGGVGATLTWLGEVGAAVGAEDELLELLSAKATTMPIPRRTGMPNRIQVDEPWRRGRPRAPAGGYGVRGAG
jgi:hypothetical protein